MVQVGEGTCRTQLRKGGREARGDGLRLRGRKVVEAVGTDRLFRGDSIRVRRMT